MAEREVTVVVAALVPTSTTCATGSLVTVCEMTLVLSTWPSTVTVWTTSVRSPLTPLVLTFFSPLASEESFTSVVANASVTTLEAWVTLTRLTVTTSPAVRVASSEGETRSDSDSVTCAAWRAAATVGPSSDTR